MTEHDELLDREDSAARERALDTARSFLVQAPAGSGKTALLMQRFLALLARVDRPERIVAVTFTRKAAAEMRERVAEALRDAAAAAPASHAHAERTRELALAALAQDERLGWQLAAHPARLQIRTIDALCASLVGQAPLASRLGAVPRFEEQAMALYRRAASDALRAAAPGDRHWEILLERLDNDAERAIALIADMLGKREQWLRELPAAAEEGLRVRLQAALVDEVRGELETIRAAFPHPLAAVLAKRERYAGQALADVAGKEPLAAALHACAEAGGLPPAAPEALDHWRALADWLLLANDAAFRRKVDARQGFPAKGNGAGAGRRGEEKAAMEEVLDGLAKLPGLAAALHGARALPPTRYGEDAWALIAALAPILRSCAAELLVAFSATGAIDYAQGLLSTLEALGEPEAPNDLLLALDRRIDHLLIDEFQDTSYSQLELVQRLTAGWQPGDGRTLFAVGDPMQSIYRFRQAEVRLFVEAQHEGHVAGIEVERLTLRRNFRAQAGLVEWVNDVFPAVLGTLSDPWRGAVGFAPAVHAREREDAPAVTMDFVADGEMEAAAVVARVHAALASGARDVGILVRARAHLERMLPALRAAGIAYEAVELDALGERTIVLDLVSLTHALAQPADRLAWLSVLRAPWCGLSLPDLFALASSLESANQASFADVVARPEIATGLSADGEARFARAAAILAPALAARGRASLAARAHGAWLALGGPACTDDPLDLVAARQFFALLGKHERAGEVPDWSAFLGALADLRAAPVADGATSAATVKVMTLHRAKGLEFDAVILPGLARAPPRGAPELMRWRRRPSGLVLAPLHARGAEEDPVYRYLGLLAEEEEDAELGRLLYVGCTRAKRRVHLTATLAREIDAGGAPQWQPPPDGSALAKLWPALPAVPRPTDPARPPVEQHAVRLARLPAGWRVPELPHSVPLAPSRPEARAEGPPPFDWARETARSIGVVAHRLFRQMGEEGVDRWPETRVAALGPRLAAELAHEGVAAAEIDAAVAQVQDALRRTLQDPRGRWLFAPGHAEVRGEYALTALGDGAAKSMVLDRTMIDETGTRWIVDFKLSRHEGAGLDAFLDSERERYRAQLEEYAAAVRLLEARPIRLGLYFPLLGGWREWSAPPGAGRDPSSAPAQG